jgi:hypothetical protein
MKVIVMMLLVGTAMGFSLRGDQGKGKRSIGKLYIENNLGLNYERRPYIAKQSTIGSINKK